MRFLALLLIIYSIACSMLDALFQGVLLFRQLFVFTRDPCFRFTRSFGMRLPDSTRREWVKPIMFTAGLGSMDSRHAVKQAAEPGMVLVKVGGPAYRIGMGGGAASSVDVQVSFTS